MSETRRVALECASQAPWKDSYAAVLATAAEFDHWLRYGHPDQSERMRDAHGVVVFQGQCSMCEQSRPEPVKAEKPDRFEHTDGDDNLVVRPHHAFDQTLVTFVNGDGVRLRQDAVNRLAQYLDWYRTDQQDCEGPCSPDTNGAPVTYPLPTGFDRCTGTYEGFRCRRSVNHEGEHA